ncbi:MAG: hypothetical protein M3R06_09440, partial [Chloroflexota bacterium]|nr:hypothetical protein [Chloroflexota bacterium]
APCSYHPSVMTGLRCSRCGKPICPRCGVRTPVGLRCPDCAGVRGLPSYQTTGSALLKATAVGTMTAAVVGLIWGYGPDWGFFLALMLGFGVAESMSWAVNGKRGRDLQLLGFALVTIGLVVSRVVLAQRFGVTWAEINGTESAVTSPENVNDIFNGIPVSYLLYLRLLPDLLFAAIPFVIIWVRFK